ncbi:hypothetical protein [Noviherbaspirillum autotrophicum]|nr:hypothetical protein [Noviherbaspirillum autotrophicum]
MTAKKATSDVSSKRTSKPAAKAAVATRAKATKPAKSNLDARTESTVAATAEPSMRFYYSKALQKKAYTVLDALEREPDHPKHSKAVADLVSELIEAGMDYYFLRALKLAKVGFIAEQSARLGVSAAVKLISSLSQKYIVDMEKNQLLVIARHIRSCT